MLCLYITNLPVALDTTIAIYANDIPRAMLAIMMTHNNIEVSAFTKNPPLH
jgi:hypothetical protein